MYTPHIELEKIARQRLAGEAQAARIAKTAIGTGPGLTQRALHRAGETFVSLGSWMKQVSLGEPSGEYFEIRFNL